jgi:hypothetical protein
MFHPLGIAERCSERDDEFRFPRLCCSWIFGLVRYWCRSAPDSGHRCGPSKEWVAEGKRKRKLAYKEVMYGV